MPHAYPSYILVFCPPVPLAVQLFRQDLYSFSPSREDWSYNNWSYNIVPQTLSLGQYHSPGFTVMLPRHSLPSSHHRPPASLEIHVICPCTLVQFPVLPSTDFSSSFHLFNKDWQLDQAFFPLTSLHVEGSFNLNIDDLYNHVSSVFLNSKRTLHLSNSVPLLPLECSTSAHL